MASVNVIRPNTHTYSVGGAVKLSIKSFTVPELFVDLPESASVSSLKVEPRAIYVCNPCDDHCWGSFVMVVPDLRHYYEIRFTHYFILFSDISCG